MLGFGDCFILCSIELPRPRSPTCVSLLASTLPFSPQLKLLHLRRLASSCDAQVESETIQSHYTLSLSLLYPLSFSLFSLSSLSFTLSLSPCSSPRQRFDITNRLFAIQFVPPTQERKEEDPSRSINARPRLFSSALLTRPPPPRRIRQLSSWAECIVRV